MTRAGVKSGLVLALAAAVGAVAAVAVLQRDRAAHDRPSAVGVAAPNAGRVSPGAAASGPLARGSDLGSGDAGSAEPAPTADGGHAGLPVRPEPDAETSVAQAPVRQLPPGVNPRDVYVDPATGMGVLRELTGEPPQSSDAVATSLPPGVYPRDVAVDPRTGAVAVKSLPGGGS